MFNALLRVWLAAFIAALAHAKCNGGYAEGHVLEQDPYWYRCTNGKMRPAGCLTDNGRRININEIYDGSNFAWQCARGRSGHLTIKMQACIKDGTRVLPGSTIEKDGYWYECKRSGSFLAGRVGGCMVDGRRIPVETKLRKDGNLWLCQLSADGGAELISTACVYQGREYLIGKTFEDDKFFYSCRMKNDRAATKVLGCVFQGRRLSAFQNYYDRDQMFRCLFSVDLKSAKHELEGCVVKDPYNGQPVEKKLGCVWEAGRPPFMYLSECVNNTNKAVVNKIRCKYDGPEGTAEIMAGCWTKVGNLGVGCKQDVYLGMKIVTFSADDESSGQYHGLTNWRKNPYACTLFAVR